MSTFFKETTISLWSKVFFSYTVSGLILTDAAAAWLNGDQYLNSQHRLKKRSSPSEFHGHDLNPQLHKSKHQSSFENEGQNKFYPNYEYGYSHSNPGFNNNRGSGSGPNKQGGYNNQGGGGFNSLNNGGFSNNQGSGQAGNTNSGPNQGSGGFSGQSNSESSSQGNVGFGNQNSGSFSNQGYLNSRPNQSSGQSNSNSRPNQNNGGSRGQSSSGSSTQSSGGSNSQGTSGTTQRPPFNIILNENTMDNSTIRDCIQTKCPSTNEYNPVCGDDNITYQNPSKFKCAQFCRSGKHILT